MKKYLFAILMLGGMAVAPQTAVAGPALCEICTAALNQAALECRVADEYSDELSDSVRDDPRGEQCECPE